MKLINLEDADNFWMIYDTLDDIKWSKNELIDAVIGEYLYVIEDIPAFISYDPTNTLRTKLWVHPNYRRLGYGSFMVDELQVNHVHATIDSLEFWVANGFTPRHYLEMTR